VAEHLTGEDCEAVILPEDQELAGFVPLLSIAYSPVYVAQGTDKVSTTTTATTTTNTTTTTTTTAASLLLLPLLLLLLLPH